jgi:microcystin-dependent protein
MAEPFLGQISMVGFNFAPRGWAFCNGQILPVNQNQSLFSLLGSTYGGDGRTSFALPDLRGRAPMHRSDGHPRGQKGGAEFVALSTNEMPQHTHSVNASSDSANAPTPNGNAFAEPSPNIYSDPANLVNMNSGVVTNTGGGGHNNMQPFLAINFIIALQGLFPPRN